MKRLFAWIEGSREIVSARGRRWPAPRWWSFARRWLWRIPRLVGLANQLYAKRYGFWAPGMFDLMDSYETLHELSASTYEKWSS